MVGVGWGACDHEGGTLELPVKQESTGLEERTDRIQLPFEEDHWHLYYNIER